MTTIASKDDDNKCKYTSDYAEEKAEEASPKKQKMISDDNSQVPFIAAIIIAVICYAIPMGKTQSKFLIMVPM
jgi:hypothetical protein